MKPAAVYARKSTAEHVSAESKSTTRQVENGRAFALARGWQVAAGRVFIDDAISGAEFERRPGLQRMLASAKRGEFEVLVVSEQKTLGREMSETPYLVKTLARAGVEVWGYLEGRLLTPKDTADKLKSVIQGYADEDYRTKTALRVHEGHERHARLGHCVGGRLYGYRNRHVTAGEDASGNPLHSHVDREVDRAEAAVVRRVFKMYAGGDGLKAIAKALTRERVAPPKYTPHAGLSAVDAWAPSTVRSILSREVYHGTIVWNARKKRDDWGQLRVTDRPEKEWVRVPAEHLRIVPEDLWQRVRSRLPGRPLRAGSGRITGRPPKGGVRNLLAGLASCASCGGGLVAETSGSTRGGKRYAYYGCARRRHQGSCANGMRLPVAETNERVLLAVEEHVLTPERVEEFLLAVEADDQGERSRLLEREARDVERRITRIVAAIEGGGEVAALTTRLRDLETRKVAIAEEVEAARPIPRLVPAVVTGRLNEWRKLLRGSVTQARAVLQRVLEGRLVFTPYPAGLGAAFEAPTRFSGLFAGVVLAQRDRAPGEDLFRDAGKGSELLWAEQASLERSYEALLAGREKAVRRTEKGLRPWRDSNPRSPP
jgi:site-specific DNA recombinase